MRLLARAGTAVAASAVMALVAAGPAAAHFCYKLGNPNNGANGQAWMTQAEWLAFASGITVVGSGETPLADCQAALDGVIAHVAALDEDVRFMGPALLAGGTLRNGNTPADIGYVPVWTVPEDCVLAFPGE